MTIEKPTNIGLFTTIRRLGGLQWRLKKQERYFNEQLPPILASLSAGPDGTLSTGTIKRINKYWQLSLNVICNSLYELTGRTLSDAEQRRILLLSIFGPLYDDLFDDQILHYEQIAAFTLEPEQHTPASFKEHVVKTVYVQVLQESPDRQRVIKHLHDVFIWQKASLKQLSPDIDEAELYEITYKKSYYSVLLAYSILDHYPTPTMLEMLYPMAGLLQLTNDAFDVYKDVQGGVYTIPNLYRNFDKLQQHFMADVAKFNHTLRDLPVMQSAKAAYAITIHALHGMGCIAMEQLKAVTRDVQSTAELATLSRQALVCDMDSFRQKLRWVKQVRDLVNYRQ
ncbi:class 1 isoprenoid biosynthesis enzyme [Chitinophaga agrisoli]|uniref:Class 1 isoprenoid biosynthesis enzyme n=1 Tax=Chitinophaga agrisoli TaxID=2607653 RepID=A0A5B2VJM4_9BACT|nr:class 1 isoprenoid biosynthesis enzyme [Chitinophaga agrisoli]KAA2238746.1 class 1 isoprenoid biosynthesis enzyme [Chitinophaga agrisoli]